VDDDKEIVRLLRSYLEKAGYAVLVAYNGETALHPAAGEARPVGAGSNAPDRDGWDITRLIRSDHHLAATPIIMLTAVEDNDKIVGLEIGAMIT
jgi:DNA-binding response OmpR family regulator